MADKTALYQKTGGFIRGMCGATGDGAPMAAAGIRWLRRDVPYPFAQDGRLTAGYTGFKENCRMYAAHGMRFIGITPYPRTFIAAGVDVTTEAGLRRAGEVCAFIAADMGDLMPCWQITNEMYVTHFRMPLNTEQARDFIIACTIGVRAGAPDAAIGHNNCSEGWMPHAQKIEEATGGSDYIGLDNYHGTWREGNIDTMLAEIDAVYARFQLPVIMMEFGFSSAGDAIDWEGGDVERYLQSVGFRDKEDILARQEAYIETLPPLMQNVARNCSPDDRKSYLTDNWTHLLKKWRCPGCFPHTEENQARYYREALPRMEAHPHLAGAVLYCWQDAAQCFSCGAPDCPCETAWGITRTDGSTKPAYDAIRAAWS